MLLGKKKRKRKRGRGVHWGRGDFPSQISKFCKIWPILYRGTMLFNIASLAKRLFAPTSPPKPQ